VLRTSGSEVIMILLHLSIPIYHPAGSGEPPPVICFLLCFAQAEAKLS